MRTFDGQGAWPRLRRVGLFPGSFNPPHIGHIDLARKAVRAADLDLCLFFVNSINPDKRGRLLDLGHRLALTGMMADDDRLAVIGGDYFSHNPGDRYLPQEQVFLPLLDRLAQSLGAGVEFFLVRGSDNFGPSTVGAAPYPTALRGLPHVIGSRGGDMTGFGAFGLVSSLNLETLAASSSLARHELSGGPGTSALLEATVQRYLARHQLLPRAPGR